MPKEIVIPKGSAPPLAPYSPGTKAGNTIYVSGTLALDEDGNTVAIGDAAGQTRHILEAIKTVVEEAGGTKADVAYNMIFIKDLADYPTMNAVYANYFPTESPARFCIRADLVRPEFLVEISSIAYV